MQYGMTSDNVNYILNKAKTKKDGVYQARGIAYKVVSNHVKYFACYGKVYEFYCGFLTQIGSCGTWSSECVKFLKQMKEK
jgi:hypothetical protein